ncbi:hypothetical protein F4680DRAFT_70119 [Xylaria scruposa]|nr:hypothetical protein F4680DRAFT_70119 [Xylaria scruposa]
MASDTDGAICQPTGATTRLAKQLKPIHVQATPVAPEPRLSNLNEAASYGNQSSFASSRTTAFSTSPSALKRAAVPSSPTTSTQDTQFSGTTDSGAFPKLLQKIKTNGLEKVHRRQPLKVFKELPVPDDARRRFEELQNLFKSGLAAHVKLESFQYTIIWAVYMVGKSEEDVEPMSVFYSDKKLAKKINSFFKQSHILETMKSSNTDFPLHFSKKSPRLLNNGFDTRPIQTSPLEGILSFYTAPLENEVFATACGLPIAATLGSSSTWATIGGNVLVDGTVFGMTAGHLLSQLLPKRNDASQSNTGSDTEDDSPILESDTSEPELDNFSTTTPPFFNPITAQRIHSRNLSESEYCEDIINLDYTLMRVPPDLHLPNRIDKSKITFGQEKTSKGLLDIIEARAEAQFDRIEVVLMSANGYKPAALKMRSASILVSPSIDFVDTLTLSPSQGYALEKGDSGSWIVEPTQGQVYGHLVAGSANGDGMVVPIHTSLKNMKELTGASTVKLPAAEDIRNLSKRITDNSSIIPIAQSAAKTTSHDGISSTNTWVTSVSSQPKVSGHVRSALPPLLEIPVSNTLPGQRPEGNFVLSNTAVRTEMPASDAQAPANDTEDAKDIKEEIPGAIVFDGDYVNAIHNRRLSSTRDSKTLKSPSDYRIAELLGSHRHDSLRVLTGDSESAVERQLKSEAFWKSYYAIVASLPRPE